MLRCSGLNTWRVRATVCGLLVVLAIPSAAQGLRADPNDNPSAPRPALPGDLVYLADVDPTIRQDMRYATARNFTGAPLPGYLRGACILRRAAAEALKRVQAELSLHDPARSLKVYDCYRPTRAVRAMVRWSKAPTDEARKAFYFPRVNKRTLFANGYISSRSTHSLGTTVDLTVVDVSREAKDDPARRLSLVKRCFDSGIDPQNPAALDMGTAYDCFDVRSHTWNSKITPAQRRNRDLLLEAMVRHGFANYRREWWHFTYKALSGKRSFDVPIR